MLEDLSINEGSFEQLKRLSGIFVPLGDPIFFQELGYPWGLLTITFDEPPVKVGKAKKGLKMFETRKLWPGRNRLHLLWVYLDEPFLDNEAQELNHCFVKLTFSFLDK